KKTKTQYDIIIDSLFNKEIGNKSKATPSRASSKKRMSGKYNRLTNLHPPHDPHHLRLHHLHLHQGQVSDRQLLHGLLYTYLLLALQELFELIHTDQVQHLLPFQWVAPEEIVHPSQKKQRVPLFRFRDLMTQ